MWKTVVILIITLIIVPILAFSYDEALTPQQEEVLYLLLKVYMGAALLTFIVSTLSRNYSQVDKVWSIMPVIYTWIVAQKAHFEPRLVLMSVLVTLWGLRLSYNFYRRGGYSWKFWSGEEDYRWSIVGVLLLMLLFYSSSQFSEQISSGKYPQYEEYKKRVGRFLPKW